MDKSITEWRKRMQGMVPLQILDAWAAKASNPQSWNEEVNYHAAAAERMKLLGHMAIDIDEDLRRKLCRQAQSIYEQLHKHLEDRPDKRSEIQSVADMSDEYYEKFGTRTARYYMYEQGLINRLGERQKLGA